jgi:hypothetical protein
MDPTQRPASTVPEAQQEANHPHRREPEPESPYDTIRALYDVCMRRRRRYGAAARAARAPRARARAPPAAPGS